MGDIGMGWGREGRKEPKVSNRRKSVREIREGLFPRGINLAFDRALLCLQVSDSGLKDREKEELSEIMLREKMHSSVVK